MLHMFLTTPALLVSVPGRPADPQPDQVPTGPSHGQDGHRGTHHPSPQLLHQAQGRQQAQ